MGIVALVTISLGTGGTAPLAFAANVRGSGTPEIKSSDVVVHIYDLEGNRVTNETYEVTYNANDKTFSCKIESDEFFEGKEYLFVLVNKTSEKKILRAATTFTKTGDVPVEITPETEVKMQVYEIWKKNPTLNIDTYANFVSNFDEEAKKTPTVKTDLTTVIDDYLTSMANWTNDTTQDVVTDDTKATAIATQIPTEDKVVPSGEKLKYAPTALKDALWTKISKSDIEKIYNKEFKAAYFYDDDYDYAFNGDSNDEDYNPNRWITFVGTHLPTVKFDELHINSKHFSDDFEGEYENNPERFDNVASTGKITLEANELDEYMGHYEYEVLGLLMYFDGDDSVELKVWKTNHDGKTYLYIIENSYDHEEDEHEESHEIYVLNEKI